jgi:hypothetical protein
MKKVRLSAMISCKRLLRKTILGIALVFFVIGSTLSSSIVFAQTSEIEVPRSPYYPQSNEDWWSYQFEGAGYQSSLEGHDAFSNTNCGPACTAMVINYLKGKGLTTHCEANRISPDYPVYCYARWLYCQANGHPSGYANSDWSLPGATTQQIRYALSLEGIQSHTITGDECKNDGTGINNVQSAIDQGKLCICLVAPMYYRDVDTYFSHWTVVYGYDANYIFLNDPGYLTGKSYRASKTDFADAIWLVQELSTVIVMDTTASESTWGKSHNVAVVDDYYGSAVGYLYPSDYPDQTFSALSASQVSAEALVSYDTVILFMFNPSGLAAAKKAAINDWVYKGGKLIIWDSDQVPPSSPWDYTWLPYPFTTSVPGQTGQTGKGLNILEENQLSSSDPSSPYYIDTATLNSQTDAVGDANVLISYGPGWRIDMMATNVLGETGPAHVYAAYGSGLLIYSALDWDYSSGATGTWLKKMLRQELNCSYLPFVAPPVPEEVGLEVEITSDKSSYDLDETIEFEVTVANPTDETGINIVAYNVWFTVVPPDEIGLESPGVCYLLGDIPPGSSQSGVCRATAKKTGDNVEVIVNAYGEDRLLKTTIAGSGKCTLTVCEPEAPKPDWAFAVITDLHIGYGYLDYGNAGFEDGNSGESYSFTEMLESAVGTIIAERDYRSIRFVVVTGDISDTAEESEFLKAREILNRFNDPNGDGNTEDGIPYIPVIGNHDTSPYTQKNNPNDRPLPGQIPGTDNLQTRATYGGDVTFNRVFWETNPSNYELILNKIDDKFLRDSVPVYSLALGHFLYLENYAFDYGGIGFVCMDAAERGPISAVYPSSSPIAKYWKQTKDFLIDQLKDHSGQELVLFSHFPLHGLGGFLDTQDVASSIVKYGCTGTLNFAGHTHRNNVQDIWKYDWLGRPAQYAYTVIETEALSQIPVELVVEGYPLVKSTHSGESIRIVQREGTEFDYSTTLKPRKQIDILWPNPFFTHTYASYPQPNSEITFTAHTIVYHGFKTSFQWDFGDGNFASGSSVTHSYSQEGEYDVTLSITVRNLLTGGETSQVVIGSIKVHSKHVISRLPPDLEATSLVTEEDLTQTPTNTYHPVLVTKKTLEETAIMELGVHFESATEDIDLSNLIADVSLEKGKSVIYMPTWPEEIDQYKQLFIPSTGAGTVYICLDATSLEDVSLENADVILNVGETKDGITVTTTFYNGREYYLVSGITGTGGGELKDSIPPTTTLTIGEPKYVTDITYITLDTPFNLTATDNPGGTGVALTVYKISNSTGYDSGWRTYTNPFNLTSLRDGNYTIAFNSTDNAGNVENTNCFNVTLVGPDVNGDGEVDMHDIALAARTFGSYRGHPRWNPIVDINLDGKVNLRDIALIARKFGKHYS